MMEPCEPVVLTGTVAPLGVGGPVSGIAKTPRPGPWRITRLGIEGDEQADLKHHGGPEKAIHHYPFDHYSAWASEIGRYPLLSQPGAFGENVSTTGWTEANIYIGDVFAFGSARLQLSQGRQPCFKLNHRFGLDGMALAVQRTGRTGWYYRVLEEGTAKEGDGLSLLERPRPEWPLARLIRLLYLDRTNRPDLAAAAVLPELAENWRALFRRRLESGAVENWSARLAGSAHP